MFSRLIVTNITSARGTVHCHKTHIPCGDQLVICGQYCHNPHWLQRFAWPQQVLLDGAVMGIPSFTVDVSSVTGFPLKCFGKGVRHITVK
jgi:hypothetical protein